MADRQMPDAASRYAAGWSHKSLQRENTMDLNKRNPAIWPGSGVGLAAVTMAMALLASGCTVVKDRQSPINEVTKGSPTVLDVYRGTAYRDEVERQKRITPQDRMREQTNARPVNPGDELTLRYWSAVEPMQQRFARVPNPDLVMVVYPHLARGPVARLPRLLWTVFPMYEQTQYALPGEVSTDLLAWRSVYFEAQHRPKDDPKADKKDAATQAAHPGKESGMLASFANVLGFKTGGKVKATGKTAASSPRQAAQPEPSAPAKAMTVAERRRMALRPPSFTDMLPYISYAPDERIFVLKDGDTLGALFELAPIPTEAMPLDILDEHAKKIQEALQAYASSDASPWIVQFFVNDDRNLDHLNQVFRDYILEQHKNDAGRGEAILNSAYTKAVLDEIGAHLANVSQPQGLFVDTQVTGQIWRGQIRRVRCCIYKRLQVCREPHRACATGRVGGRHLDGNPGRSGRARGALHRQRPLRMAAALLQPPRALGHGHHRVDAAAPLPWRHTAARSWRCTHFRLGYVRDAEYQ
ncbi:hypothetical protein FQA39_LY19400 [Lamprigera yunnana]|nr:hypothetical protein FQA39_LY19400 [Lamprigera yunnana]